jgi:hypothetical protein
MRFPSFNEQINTFSGKLILVFAHSFRKTSATIVFSLGRSITFALEIFIEQEVSSSTQMQTNLLNWKSGSLVCTI